MAQAGSGWVGSEQAAEPAQDGSKWGENTTLTRRCLAGLGLNLPSWVAADQQQKELATDRIVR